MSSVKADFNMISSETILYGELLAKTDLRVSGRIEGKVLSESRCIVSKSGTVKGDIVSREADIAGTVEGDVRVSGRLVLRSSAKILGDLITKVLMVEEGAQIQGACRMDQRIELPQWPEFLNGNKNNSQPGKEKDTIKMPENS